MPYNGDVSMKGEVRVVKRVIQIRMQDGDGEAESFFHIMKARRVSRTEISLRMYAAL